MAERHFLAVIFVPKQNDSSELRRCIFYCAYSYIELWFFLEWGLSDFFFQGRLRTNLQPVLKQAALAADQVVVVGIRWVFGAPLFIIKITAGKNFEIRRVQGNRRGGHDLGAVNTHDTGADVAGGAVDGDEFEFFAGA